MLSQETGLNNETADEQKIANLHAFFWKKARQIFHLPFE